MQLPTFAQIKMWLIPAAHADYEDYTSGTMGDTLGDLKPDAIPTDDGFFVLLGKIINFFLEMVGIGLLIAILYAGFLLLTAEGDEEKVAQARKIIAYAIVGVVILSISFALVAWLLTGDSPFVQN